MSRDPFYERYKKRQREKHEKEMKQIEEDKKRERNSLDKLSLAILELKEATNQLPIKGKYLKKEYIKQIEKKLNKIKKLKYIKGE